jgi:hypothetical protein
MRQPLLWLLLVLPALRAETAVPAPTKPDEPAAKTFNAANAATYLDGVGLDWTRTRGCATCHTNVPFMLARPKWRRRPEPMREVRGFLERTVRKWEKEKPRADYEVVATAFALSGNDATTTGKLHPLTKAALDRMWTVQQKDGSWMARLRLASARTRPVLQRGLRRRGCRDRPGRLQGQPGRPGRPRQNSAAT